MEVGESAPPANELASSSALSSEPRERRKRKEVVRLAPQRVEAKAAFAIPEGRGVPLGSLAGFAESLSREKDADFLKKIHRFLFASPGEASKRRANIRNFSGSAFPKDVAPEKLASWTTVDLKKLASMMSLPTGGNKDDLCARISSFVFIPSSSSGCASSA